MFYFNLKIQYRLLLGICIFCFLGFLVWKPALNSKKGADQETLESSPRHVDVLIETKKRESLGFYSKEILNLKNQWKENKSTEGKEILTEAIVQFSFNSMHMLRSNVNKDHIRQAIMDELVQDPASLVLSSKILIDTSFTKSRFEKDQAVARIYAIKLLRYAADRGDSSPLIRTSQELTEVLSLKKSVAIGEWRDLEEVLINTIEVVGPNEISQNLEAFLHDYAYKSDTQEMKKAFRNAFYFALIDRVSEEELRQFMKTLKAA